MDKGKQAERLMNSSLPAALVPAYSGKEKTATLNQKNQEAFGTGT